MKIHSLIFAIIVAVVVAVTFTISSASAMQKEVDLAELFQSASLQHDKKNPDYAAYDYNTNYDSNYGSKATENAKDDSAPHFRLTYNDAEEALAIALIDRGAGEKITTKITNRTTGELFNHSQPISVEIRGLRFDPATHRFSANLVAVSDAEIVSTRAISGRFDRMVEIPVLKKSLRAGEIIKEADIELRDYSEARVHRDTITDIASLLGKTPQRMISATRPVRSHELAEESLVKKNNMVTMLYKQGAMQITTTGQAENNGALGSVIGVRNLASGKIIHAVVTGDKTVEVNSNETQAEIADNRILYAN